MVTDRQAHAACEAYDHGEDYTVSFKHMKAALEAAGRAAWSDDIKAIPSDKLLIVESQWVKTGSGEKLPPEYHVAMWKGEQREWFDGADDWIDLNPVRWQPLPEPPE